MTNYCRLFFFVLDWHDVSNIFGIIKTIFSDSEIKIARLKPFAGQIKTFAGKFKTAAARRSYYLIRRQGLPSVIQCTLRIYIGCVWAAHPRLPQCVSISALASGQP
jgi:hypothetical protein